MKNSSSSVILIWTVLIAVLAGVTAAFFHQLFNDKTSPPSLQRLPYLGETGSFRLKSSDSEEVTQDDLKGKIWVADFIFTRCQGQCPFMLEKMRELREPFAQNGNLKFVSISVDPENDTPEVLQKYREQHGIRSDQWLFLTGSLKEIQELARKRFKLGVDSGGNEVEPIIHSNRFVLVDSHGIIRGYYSAASPDDFEALKKALAELLENSTEK